MAFLSPNPIDAWVHTLLLNLHLCLLYQLILPALHHCWWWLLQNRQWIWSPPLEGATSVLLYYLIIIALYFCTPCHLHLYLFLLIIVSSMSSFWPSLLRKTLIYILGGASCSWEVQSWYPYGYPCPEAVQDHLCTKGTCDEDAAIFSLVVCKDREEDQETSSYLNGIWVHLCNYVAIVWIEIYSPTHLFLCVLSYKYPQWVIYPSVLFSVTDIIACWINYFWTSG